MISMMKRTLALLLAALMLFAFTACSNEDDSITKDPVININIQAQTYTDSHGDTFTYKHLNSTTVAITGFSGVDTPHVVTIPATIVQTIEKEGGQTEKIEKKVVAIDSLAFRAKSNISGIKCEAQLETIGSYAFAYCEALETVELPDSLKTIGEAAFYHCSSLVTCDLGAGLIEIGGFAFANCALLPAVTFPASLKRIDMYAFAECSALTAIEFSEGLTVVGAQAFYNCNAVERLVLPASLTEIGEYPFNPFIRTLPDEAITVVEGSVAAQHIDQFR
jgi:hypothetical protein